MALLTALKLVDAITENLKPREKEVIFGRFGLGKEEKPQTLAAIGNRYGVTRERVRQIESAALSAVRVRIAHTQGAREAIDQAKKILKESGGIAAVGDLVAALSSTIIGITDRHGALLREASHEFEFYPEDDDFAAFYYLDRAALKSALGFIKEWIAHLKNRKQQVLAGKYATELQEFLKKKGLRKDHAERVLALSKRVHTNPYGDTGLTEWSEVKPQTIRDRVYVVLKKKGAPLHFRTIAESITKAGFDSRAASAPTVHNELIKDPRFVLVGRGMYALSEHGYEPGTAREVIHRILMKQGAMRAREVMLAVQKERFFKPNTILVNLQNKAVFERLPDGTYRVREA